MRFRICNPTTPHMARQARVINDHYFTVDTASGTTVDSWRERNIYKSTYALDDADNVAGFIEILPITETCGQLLAENNLREEDITSDFLLPPTAMVRAQYAYLSGIAIRDINTWHGAQCAAALIACACGMMRYFYRADHLQTIFANPTTYWGNRLVAKFGLRPLAAWKKPLRAGNDIYATTITPAHWQGWGVLEQRYQRFITDYPWDTP